ncbi:MAG: LamG domain-containing protein [Clostridia bacterium]|nr:LamG domain-containing protein [Clostridia bacterium]
MTNRKIAGRFYIEDAYKSLASDYTVSIDTIYDVSVTYNGNIMAFYINGEPINDDNYANNVIKPSNVPYVLGGNPGVSGGVAEKFYGKIYSAKIYNKALSVDEVKHNYLIDKAKYGIEE